MDLIIDQMIAEYDLNTCGSFRNHLWRKRTLSKWNPRPCTTTEDVIVATAQADSARNRNVAAIFRGDGEFHLSFDSYFGSSSHDGTVSGL